MARTVEQIQETMFKAVQENSVLNKKLTSISKTTIWRLTIYIVAVCSWTLEKLFDNHKAETNYTIQQQKAHKVNWYCNKAKAFQFGHSLVYEEDYYKFEDEKARIIKHASVKEVETDNGLLLEIKVAKDASGSLAELTPPELAAFKNYIKRVKDAGVKLRIISQEADQLRLTIDLYYDPLVFNEQGERLDGTSSTPVQDAISEYLENLPFNGEFSIMSLTDKLQKVQGVAIPQVISAESRWGTYEWSGISAKYTPEAGWLKVYDGDLTINWIPNV